MPGVPPPRYAYLGPAGTFAEAALRTLPAAATAVLLPAVTVAGALDLVRSGAAEAALVPLENSVEGSVAVTLDELATGEPLRVLREVVLAVGFALLTRPGIALSEVRDVATHPHAAAQCRGWLARHLPDAVVHPAASTADGAQLAAAGTVDAAIAAPAAAARFGLRVLAEPIGDDPTAQTRFVLVGRPGPPAPPTGTDRTSLVVYIADDHPGALLEVLTEFAVRGVNLSRIESRPTGEQLGRYCFSLDVEGHVADARLGEALAALYRRSAGVRFLGSYPRAQATGAPVPPGTSDADFADAHAWLTRLRAEGV